MIRQVMKAIGILTLASLLLWVIHALSPELLVYFVCSLAAIEVIPHFTTNKRIDEDEETKLKVGVCRWCLVYILLIDLPLTIAIAWGYARFFRRQSDDYSFLFVLFVPALVQFLFKPLALLVFSRLKNRKQVLALWISMGLLFVLNVAFFGFIALWN